MKPFLYILLLLFSTVAFCKEKRRFTTADTLSADAVFNRSEAAYANLKVYLDSGKVIEEFDISTNPYKIAKLFKTAYTNTGQFNFEYYELGKSNSLYTINQTLGVVKTWWGLTNKTETPKDLNMALSGALGVSARSSYIIPGLLLVNDLKKPSNIYRTSHNIVLKGSELVNGLACYRIDGEESDKGKISIWITKKDFLIRKIATENTVNMDRTRSAGKKLDSIARSYHLNDTAYLRKDSIKQAKRAVTEAAAAAFTKAVLSNSQMNSREFNVKRVYYITPYTVKKVNPDLFKFRPNREIEL